MYFRPLRKKPQRKLGQWFTKISPSKGQFGRSNACNLSLQRCGRRKVDFGVVKGTELQGSPQQVGLHNMPSSPASPTKETVVRLFLFLSFLTTIDCPKAPKALGFPTKTGIQGLLFCFMPILICLSLFSPISIPFVGSPVGTPTRHKTFYA